MRFTAIAASICLAVAGCSSGPYELNEKAYSQRPFIGVPPDVSKIRFQGSVYHRLMGTKLEQAIVGKSMFHDPNAVIISGDGQYFASDGCGYARNRDRVGPAFGTYRVKEDRVCTKVGDQLSCFALFQSDEGRWLIHGLSGPSVPSAVLLNPDDRYRGLSCPLVDPF